MNLPKKYGVLILEDNPYGDLRVSGENVPTVKNMDEDGIVIYAAPSQRCWHRVSALLT